MISVKNVLIKLKLLKMCFLKRECEQNIQERSRSRGPGCRAFYGGERKRGGEAVPVGLQRMVYGKSHQHRQEDSGC